MDKEQLFFQEKNEIIYIKAVGHITASVCTDLRNIVYQRLDSNEAVQNLYFDLSECTYMDSTFMGLLVGFHKKLKAGFHKSLDILNPNDTCFDLLKVLGIHRILNVVKQDIEFPENMRLISKSAETTTELLLRAHENLIDLSDENKDKFNLLQKILKKQMEDEEKK